MKPIKLSELIAALEFDSEEHVARIDLQEGCVITVDRMVLSAVDEEDEEALQDLPDWQKSELQVARLMVADSGERFVDAPDKFDFHEYRQMERFVGTVEDSEAAEQLWRAIKGKGAFAISRTRPVAWVCWRVGIGIGTKRSGSSSWLGPRPTRFQLRTILRANGAS